MHTYKYNAPKSLWVVGHYTIKGYEDSSSEEMWIPMRGFKSEYKAAAYTNFLNGGRGDPSPRFDEGEAVA